MWNAKRHPMMNPVLRNENGVVAACTIAVIAVAGSAICAALIAGGIQTGELTVATSRIEAEVGPVWIEAGVASVREDLPQEFPVAPSPQVGSDTAGSLGTFVDDEIDQAIWRG